MFSVFIKKLKPNTSVDEYDDNDEEGSVAIIENFRSLFRTKPWCSQGPALEDLLKGCHSKGGGP